MATLSMRNKHLHPKRWPQKPLFGLRRRLGCFNVLKRLTELSFLLFLTVYHLFTHVQKYSWLQTGIEHTHNFIPLQAGSQKLPLWDLDSETEQIFHTTSIMYILDRFIFRVVVKGNSWIFDYSDNLLTGVLCTLAVLISHIFCFLITKKIPLHLTRAAEVCPISLCNSLLLPGHRHCSIFSQEFDRV